MPDATVARVPILILVGGPGGCGKSTLARLLGDEMGVLHISRDAVKASIAVTEAGREAGVRPHFDAARSAMGGEFGQRAFGATYGVVDLLLQRGASIVIDQAWRRDHSEPELLPLIRKSRAVQLHVSTSPEVAQARALARGHRDGLASLGETVVELENAWESFDPLDIGVPTLRVDTTDGYMPAFDDIACWVWSSTA